MDTCSIQQSMRFSMHYEGCTYLKHGNNRNLELAPAIRWVFDMGILDVIGLGGEVLKPHWSLELQYMIILHSTCKHKQPNTSNRRHEAETEGSVRINIVSLNELKP